MVAVSEENAIELVDDCLSLRGLLSVDTVSTYYQDGLMALERGGKLTVDLGDIEIVGSAGIALLIAWQRRAGELGKPFSIRNAPEHFLDMARVSGVEEILAFTPKVAK